MKQNNQVSYEWPVILENFIQDETQENFSRGKLKVFFEGETPDHRYFSHDFATKLIKSLPYTPIVSYYDSEAKDFIGHSENQQIYGLVDPCKECTFEKDDQDKTWCVCDVVLYTERPDELGEIAKQIIGHPQSLELDPKTTKYTINYDEQKHFKNIEFTEGKFVGISVLGNNQKPAFTGSEFFSFNENDFKEKMLILSRYCKKRVDNNMDLQKFIQLSWGEQACKVNEALSNEYADTAYVEMVDIDDQSIIARFYFYIENVSKLMRVNYSIDEEMNVHFGDVKEVHVVYEDVEDVKVSADQPSENNYEDNNNADVDANVDQDNQNNQIDQNNTEDNNTITTNLDNCDNKDNNNSSNETAIEENHVDEITNTNEKADVNIDEASCHDDDDDDKEDDEDKDNYSEEKGGDQLINEESSSKQFSVESTQNSNTASEAETNTAIDSKDNNGANVSVSSFTDSERAEFEALKREKRLNLINNYKDLISEDSYNYFVSNVDNYTDKDDDSLELELLRAYKKFLESDEEGSSKIKPMRVFALTQNTTNNAEYSSSDKLDSFVRKHLRYKN